MYYRLEKTEVTSLLEFRDFHLICIATTFKTHYFLTNSFIELYRVGNDAITDYITTGFNVFYCKAPNM